MMAKSNIHAKEKLCDCDYEVVDTYSRHQILVRCTECGREVQFIEEFMDDE